MKIKMVVKIVKTNNEFEEIYDIENNIVPQEYAEKLINNFNATLRANESPRELISVEVIEKDSEMIHQHTWEKQNLVTIVRGSSSYDIMKCSRCGVTGKRHGLGGGVQRDSKYKAKCYNTCEGAIKHINKCK